MPPAATGTTANFDYIVSGANARGARKVEAISAATPDAAIEEMRVRGYTDIKLHTDDLLRTVLTSPESRRRQQRLSAKDRLRLQSMTPMGRILFRLKVYYKAFGFLVAASIVLLVMRRVNGRALGVLDGVAALGILLPLLISIFKPPVGGARRRAEAAMMEGRYEDVLKVLPALRREMLKLGEAAAAASTAETEAKALAAMGRLDEALEVMDRLRKRGDVPEAEVVRLTAVVYGWAKDYEGMLDCLERAAELDPTGWLAWAGMAELLALRLQRPQEAKVALEVLSQFTLAESSKRTLVVIQAGIDLCEGRNEAARSGFESALATAKELSSKSPSARGLVAKYQAYLSIACGRLGRLDEARKYYRAAEPVLVATKDQDLMDRCKQVIKNLRLAWGRTFVRFCLGLEGVGSPLGELVSRVRKKTPPTLTGGGSR